MNYLEKKSTPADILTDSTTQKECAIIVIIDSVATKSHGTARIPSSTPTECARIATSTTTTKSEERLVLMNKCPWSL